MYSGDRRARHAPFEAVQQQVAVAQPGELVVERRMAELVLSTPADDHLAFEVFLLLLDLRRPLQDPGLERVHERGQHACQRVELFRAVLLEPAETSLVLHGPHRGTGQRLHGVNEPSRRPVTYPVDDGQVEDAYHADEEHHETAARR